MSQVVPEFLSVFLNKLGFLFWTEAISQGKENQDLRCFSQQKTPDAKPKPAWIQWHQEFKETEKHLKPRQKGNSAFSHSLKFPLPIILVEFYFISKKITAVCLGNSVLKSSENNWYFFQNNPIYPLSQLLRGLWSVCGLGSLRKCNEKKPKKGKGKFSYSCNSTGIKDLLTHS